MSIRLLMSVLVAGVHYGVDGATLSLSEALEADLVAQGKAVYVYDPLRRADQPAIASEIAGIGVPRISRAESGLMIDAGVNTGIVAAGIWSMIAGGVIDTTVTEATDGDGFYVSYVCPIGGAGTTDRASAAMPAAYQDLSSGGELDLVVDVVLPSDVAATACDLMLYLGNASDMANSRVRTFQYLQGGTAGALKPGRNILTANILGSSYQDTWTVNGSGTFSSPITHVALRMNNATSGMEIKIRELRYRAIGVPGIIFGLDDGHGSVYWVYKLAAGLGLRGVLPVVGSYIGLPSYMTLAQVQELKSLGFTPLDHTWAHTDLTSVTYDQARAAMRTNKQWMLANGLGWLPILVYPYGKYNLTVIQAAIDEGYLFARTAGKNQIRSLPRWGVENPYRLGSIDIGGKSLATIKTWLTSISSDEQSSIGWLYGHHAVAGNPAEGSAAPGDTLTWYAGWYRQLVQQMALLCAQGKLRSLNGEDFVRLALS